METTGERVRDAALELFAERGYHGTGIRQLAERAGLSSASLYHYMGTKEDLLVAIMRESLERLVGEAMTLIAEQSAPPQQVAALVRMHVRAHAERPRETRVVDGEVGALEAGTREEIIGLRDRYEQIWQGVIDAGIDAGEFHVGSPSVARRALLEMCSGVARWYDDGGALSLDALADQYAEMGLRLLVGPS